MKNPIFIFLYTLLFILCFSCSIRLPGDLTAEEYMDVILEGESGLSVIPDFSFCSLRQVKELGGQLSLGLGIALIDRTRIEEAEHLLSLIVDVNSDGWGEYAESILQFLRRGDNGVMEDLHVGISPLNRKTEPDLLKEQALRAIRTEGRNGLSGFIVPFLLLPAGDIHRELLDQFYSMGYTLEDLNIEDRELVSGKLSLLEKDYTAAGELLKLVVRFGYGGASGVVEDLVKVFRRTSRLSEGGEFLASAAEAESDAEKQELLLGAGRLFRWAGKYERGAEVLEKALKTASADGGQRILWYLQDCLLKSEPQKAAEILTKYAPLWEDPGYFSDTIEELTALFLRNRYWAELEDILPLVLRYGTDELAAGILYIYARLGEEGFYSGNSLESHGSGRENWSEIFTRVIERMPGSYYAWLSRKRLGDAGISPGENFPVRFENTRIFPQGELLHEKGDPVLFLLTELGYYSLAFTWLDEWYSGSPEDDRRTFLKLAKKLQDDNLWLDSIRLISRLSRKRPLELRDPLEMSLYYPRAYREPVEKVAEKYDHPPQLLFGLIREESGFTASIESWAGAVGLMQIMPSTAEDVAARMDIGDWDLKNPGDNLEMGSWYLDWLESYVGGLMPAVLSYNGGPGRIRGYMADLEELPPDLLSEALPMAETRKYGAKVLVSCIHYGYLYYGISPETTIGSFFPEL